MTSKRDTSTDKPTGKRRSLFTENEKEARSRDRSQVAADPIPLMDVLPVSQSNLLLRQAQILQMQRTYGNSIVQRYLAGKTDGLDTPITYRISRKDDVAAAPKSLEEVLGYRPNISDAAVRAGAMHPMTASIVLRMKALLEASILAKDKPTANALYRSLKKTIGNLRETLRRMGDAAPDRTLWSSEFAAWSHVLGEVDSGFWNARHGSWSTGRDKHWMRMLVAVDEKLIRSLSPFKAKAKETSPGVAVKRKIPIGTVPLIGAILNIYVNLEITKKPTKSIEGASTKAALEIDDEGKLKPSASLAIEGAEGAKVAAAVSAEGPEISGETGKTKVGGGAVSGAAKVGLTGAEASMKVEDPGGWLYELKATSDGGVAYSIFHPKAGGVELSGSLDKFSLQAIAPEITFDDMLVKGSLEVEVIPAPHFWPKTLTQKADVLEFWRTYKIVVLSLAAVTIAAPVIAAGVEALPAVVIALGKKAPVLIRAAAH